MEPTLLVYDNAELGRRLAIREAPYSYKDILKALPGASWDPNIKAWHYPATASSFMKLRTLFPKSTLDHTACILEGVANLLEVAERCKSGEFELSQPSIRKTDGWKHQLRAYWFALYRLQAQGGAMLALDMGTGKSKVTIDLINNMRNEDRRPTLVMCPTSVINVWKSEWERHSPVGQILCLPKGMSVTRRTAMAKEFLEVNNCGVVVINHEGVWRSPFKEFALSMEWNFGIVDESHRAKAPGGVFSKFLKTLRSRCRYRLDLTGTPAPHSPLDLYAQARFIDPSVFGDSNANFRARYAVVKHMGNYDIVLGYKNKEELNDKFHTMAIQIKARECLDLPEAQHVMRSCELGTAEARAYKEMKKDMIVLVQQGAVTAKNALAKLMRLAQITQGVVKTEDGKEVEIGRSKIELLRDVLEDLNEPVVVFCRFKSDLQRTGEVAEELEKPHYELSGEVNELDEWKEACADSPAVLAVQLQAGGVGISMVEARYCVYLSVDFNLGNYDQSAARVLRPGQEKNVTYIHLVAEGTIDETIYNALSKRKDIVEAILDEMKKGDEDDR